jgi:hypothetical protein
MASPSSDVVVLTLGIILAALYLFRSSIFPSSDGKKLPPTTTKAADNGSGDPRDFVAKMKAGVSPRILSSEIHSVIRFTRKNGSQSSMVRRQGLLKNMPFVWPRKPNPVLASHRWSATQKNMTSRIWISFLRSVP